MVFGMIIPLLVFFYLGHAIEIPFYKGVVYPWVLKETQYCFNSTLCPQRVDYTWDWFFNTIMDKGAKRFIFQGYSIIDSKIAQDPSFYPPWNKSAFAGLKKKVAASGGSIWLTFGQYFAGNFNNESLFRQSVKQFMQDYSVDGFVFHLEKPEHAKDAYRILKTVKALGKTAVLQYRPWTEYAFKKHGLADLVDYILVSLDPTFDTSLATVFNTNDHAIKMINNAMKAGAKARSTILRISLGAWADYGSTTGYSNAIFFLKGDPKGNGSFLFPSGGGFYFFSQPRAVDKVTLVKKMGLGGIMLDPSYIEFTDIYPWDDRSIFHALAKAVKE